MMNKYFVYCLLGCSLWSASCGSSASDPKDVAIQFLNARNKMDYETAKKFGTNATDSTMNQLAAYTKMVDSGVMALTSKTEVEVIGEAVVTGDSATVRTINTIGGKKIEETLLLIKEKDGRWYVHDNPWEYAPNIVTAIDEEDSTGNESTVEINAVDSTKRN